MAGAAASAASAVTEVLAPALAEYESRLASLNATQDALASKVAALLKDAEDLGGDAAAIAAYKTYTGKIELLIRKQATIAASLRETQHRLVELAAASASVVPPA